MAKYLVYKSIGNPERIAFLGVASSKKVARGVATQLNGGVWYDDISQASPYFIAKLKQLKLKKKK